MSAAARLQGLGGPRKLGEREYTDDDVRKGLRYIQAAVDTGGAAPTGYAVAQLLKLPSSERAIKRGWAEVLKYPGDDAAQRAARIDSYVAPAWGGAREESIIFTEDEEAMLQTAVDIAAEGGFGVSVEYVRELMRDVLAAPDREIKSARRDVSKTTVKAWMKKRSIRRYKANSIDPARVAKATEEVCDKWFARVDSYVRTLYSQGKIPWKCWAEVPAECKLNVRAVVRGPLPMHGTYTYIRSARPENVGGAKKKNSPRLPAAYKPI